MDKANDDDGMYCHDAMNHRYYNLPTTFLNAIEAFSKNPKAVKDQEITEKDIDGETEQRVQFRGSCQFLNSWLSKDAAYHLLLSDVMFPLEGVHGKIDWREAAQAIHDIRAYLALQVIYHMSDINFVTQFIKFYQEEMYATHLNCQVFGGDGLPELCVELGGTLDSSTPLEEQHERFKKKMVKNAKEISKKLKASTFKPEEEFLMPITTSPPKKSAGR